MTDILGTFTISTLNEDLADLLLLRAHQERGHRHLVRRALDRRAPRTVLPERARVVRTVDAGHTCDVLTEVDEILVLLRLWKANAEIWASGTDEDAIRGLLKEMTDRMPPRVEDRQVEVCFTDAGAGCRHLPLDVAPWTEIADNYSTDVRRAIETLTEHRAALDEARRLVLWHGAPGTGKTSAVRALTHSWKPWADPVVVNDPEQLLADGKYLRRIILDQDEDNDRWKLIVLEDAEALLRKDTGGRGMAKLLNLADGLLGQGLRCLWLITTNEQVGALHPALVRPGRCLARIEFGVLPAAHASSLLGRPAHRPMTLAELYSAKPVSVRENPVAVGQYL